MKMLPSTISFVEDLEPEGLVRIRFTVREVRDGGEDGRCGRNLFLRKNGPALNLGGKNEIQAQPQDRFRIETPGGGGWGQVKDS